MSVFAALRLAATVDSSVFPSMLGILIVDAIAILATVIPVVDVVMTDVDANKLSP